MLHHRFWRSVQITINSLNPTIPKDIFLSFFDIAFLEFIANGVRKRAKIRSKTLTLNLKLVVLTNKKNLPFKVRILKTVNRKPKCILFAYKNGY